jgi:hypothetical protein
MADTPTGDMRGRYAALVARLDAADVSTDRVASRPTSSTSFALSNARSRSSAH